MIERSKLTSSHLRRQAFVYLRQSSQTQVERNVESTARQYALVERAIELGFTREQVLVIDEDLGISGSGMSDRSGFARLAAEVALGHAGLVLGLEVSRLARNNVDWYRLLDLCGVTDTVIGDADGLYHPGSFNDRLLLGLKGTMSEAELHVLRARLEGGIRNKAQRGELRKALPIGLVWGEEEGEILFDGDEAIRGALGRSSTGSPSWGRCGRCGCGCAAKACSSHCAAGRTSCGGSPRPTIRSTACSRARYMPARTRSGRPAGSDTSTSTGTRANGCVGSRKQNGVS